MSQPGAGTIMYNSAETVKRFPGMSQSAIMPPHGSAAGAGYRSAFGAAHGFDPYAADGFVPNFAAKFQYKGKEAAYSKKFTGRTYGIPASDIGVLLGFSGSVPPTKDFKAKARSLAGLSGSPVGKKLQAEDAWINLQGVRVKSFMQGESEQRAEAMFEDEIRNNLKGGLQNLAKNMMTQMGIEGRPGKVGRLNEAVQGEIFEESMRMAMKAAVATPGAAFDFEAGAKPSPAMSKIFGTPISRIDAKRRLTTAGGGEMPKKYFNDPGTRKKGLRLLGGMRGAGRSMGFVPNFSPLTDSVGRELAAGVPASAIRVGSSPALRSAGNPRGVGVYNTIHEPGGLRQGISRSRSQGINPKSHGVPNFVTYEDPKIAGGAPLSRSGKIIIDTSDLDRTAKKEATTAKTNKMSARKMERAAGRLMFASMAISMAGPGVGQALGSGTPSSQAAWSGGSNILSMAAMGAMAGMYTGNPFIALGGGIAGAGLGALGMDWGMAFGEEGEKRMPPN